MVDNVTVFNDVVPALLFIRKETQGQMGHTYSLTKTGDPNKLVSGF
jgi:hypothetical protein